MIKHTEPYNISQIFSNEITILYKIPKYQREYTWGQKEWSQLFNDMIENDSGYFLGSIICVNTNSNSRDDVVFEVIDGQQRITSLSILLTTLYEKLVKYKEKFADDEDKQSDLNTLKKKLVKRKKDQYIARLTPQIQNNNKDDYLSLLCEVGLLADKTKPQNAGNRRIYRAHNHFSNAIDKYIQEIKEEQQDKDDIDILFDLVNKFYSAILVSIEVETHKDAYMLFESLNNRGVPLSAIDLIKNMLISISDDEGKSESCYTKWKNILTYLGEDYKNQERFFRQYYNAFREELNQDFPAEGKTKYALGYLATKTTLLDIYEKLIKKDYEKFLDKIVIEAKNYSILINNASEEDCVEELTEPLLNLERIGGAPSYILLLYLLSKQNNLNIDNTTIANIINYLTKFFVRRNLTDYPNTRNLTKIFMDIVADISTKQGTDVYTSIVTILKENSSDDKIFETKLRGPIYIDNPDVTRFLLCFYEDKFKTNEIHTNLWNKDKNNKYIWTIEHIFPEGENIPQDWIDMIAEGKKELAYQYLEKYVHTLGNLTITGYNQNLSNLSFTKKKDRKNSEDKYIGYRNGLELNKDVVNQEKWLVKNITDRTDSLVTTFLEDFKL